MNEILGIFLRGMVAGVGFTVGARATDYAADELRHRRLVERLGTLTDDEKRLLLALERVGR